MKANLEATFYPLLFYLFLFSIALFLAVTVGGAFSALAGFLFFLLLLDLGQVVWTETQLFQSEVFSNDHPIKGEAVLYKHTFEGGNLPVRSCRIDLEYSFAGPLSTIDREKSTIWLGPKKKKVTERTYRLRHRGIYTLGLSSLNLISWTGWFQWSLPLWPRTFYVRPRILSLRDFPLDPSREGGGELSSLAPPRTDPGVFDHVTPYRPGQSIRGMDLRPLARGADPVTRLFIPENWNQTEAALDLYRPSLVPEGNGEGILEAEDLVVEVCGSLVLWLLNRGIPVRLWSWQDPTKPWTLTTPEDLEPWIEASVSFRFFPAPSLARLWAENGLAARGEGGLFFSHRPDPFLWEFLSQFPGVSYLFQLTAGWSEADLLLWTEAREGLSRAGVRTWSFASLEELEGFSRGS